MPRPIRHLLVQSYYHIMTRGNNKNVVFRSENDYKYYLELIGRYKAEHPFDLFHYCLLPSHTHFEIRAKTGRDFSVFMKKINLAYFHYYRKRYGWVGHFWQGRFRSQPVGKDDYFIQCGKYIELNPVRKRLVREPQEWPYSSYCFYSQGQPNDLVTRDFLYEELGDNPSERQRKYTNLLIDSVVEGSYQRDVWGSGQQRYSEQQKARRRESEIKQKAE